MRAFFCARLSLQWAYLFCVLFIMLSPFSVPALEGTPGPVALEKPAFISDLHLTAREPETVEGFLRFLSHEALAYHELVILGDFFDYWIGDDEAFAPGIRPITEALARFSSQRRLFLMQGNRDFIMGSRYARAAGGTLLRDPAVAETDGVRILLSHGDRWCTLDADYQKLRRRVRSVWWQWLAMRLPLAKRRRIAEDARRRSTAKKTLKDARVTDVVAQDVAEAARAAGCSIVIHGHVHLPRVTEPAPGIVCAVLPDWHFAGGRAERGGWCSIEGGRPVLHFFRTPDDPHPLL
jgi:UDP-2,3-diacylglucosamine hydrolase